MATRTVRIDDLTDVENAEVTEHRVALDGQEGTLDLAPETLAALELFLLKADVSGVRDMFAAHATRAPRRSKEDTDAIRAWGRTELKGKRVNYEGEINDTGRLPKLLVDAFEAAQVAAPEEDNA